LLANAIKFTPTGGTVTITTRTEGSIAVIEVTDTGPGIPADELPHVFDRFWRGRVATSTSGSGIGLAVVAELVRAHNGRVEVTSPPDRGAQFRVLLPAP
jgi:two-component system sensor histidine kinase BaeS